MPAHFPMWQSLSEKPKKTKITLLVAHHISPAPFPPHSEVCARQEVLWKKWRGSFFPLLLCNNKVHFFPTLLYWKTILGLHFCGCLWIKLYHGRNHCCGFIHIIKSDVSNKWILLSPTWWFDCAHGESTRDVTWKYESAICASIILWCPSAIPGFRGLVGYMPEHITLLQQSQLIPSKELHNPINVIVWMHQRAKDGRSKNKPASSFSLFGRF